MTITRTAPPYSADEVTMLRGFLDYFRSTLRRQAEGLDADQLATPLSPSPMTLGGRRGLGLAQRHGGLPGRARRHAGRAGCRLRRLPRGGAGRRRARPARRTTAW